MIKMLCDNCQVEISQKTAYRVVFVSPRTKKAEPSNNPLDMITGRMNEKENISADRELCGECFARFHILSGLRVIKGSDK